MAEFKTSPLLSVVVPTLKRSDTLKSTLETLTRQSFGDCEFVIQNNGNDGPTRALVESIDDPRLVHFSSDKVLPMVENWETALHNARGEYITFIGDDDGFLPESLTTAAAILPSAPAVLNWLPFHYYWPDYNNSDFANKLFALVSLNDSITELRSGDLLNDFYQSRIDYSQLPMIYNSFVSRRLIGDVTQKAGRFFFGIAPDVVSGILLSAFTDTFLRVSRPLTVAGTSRHSTGHNMFFSSKADFDRVVGEGHLSFPDSSDSFSCAHLLFQLANDMLAAKQRLGGLVRIPELNILNLLKSVARRINDNPLSYDAIVEDLTAQCRSRNFAIADLPLPERLTKRFAPAVGLRAAGKDMVQFIIDADAAKARTISDVARFAHQLLPELNDASFVVQARRLARPLLESGGVLDFSNGEIAALALVDGWGAPEPWGAWSVEKECTIEFRIPDERKDRWVELEIRPFLHEVKPIQDVECRVGSWSSSWSISAERLNEPLIIRLPADAIGEGELVKIWFRIREAESMSKLGIGEDPRVLGFGAKRLIARW